MKTWKYQIWMPYNSNIKGPRGHWPYRNNRTIFKSGEVEAKQKKDARQIVINCHPDQTGRFISVWR